MYGVEVGLGSSEENIEPFLFQLPNVIDNFLRVNIFFSPFFEHFLLKCIKLTKVIRMPFFAYNFCQCDEFTPFFVSLDCT